MESRLTSNIRGKDSRPVMAIVVMLAFLPVDAVAEEQIVTAKASQGVETVNLLARPHGNILCKVEDHTPVRFIKSAKHGPHKFGQVIVLSGNCADQKGFISWHNLQPEPLEN